MQVTETLSEGLKRELKIVVPATDLGTRLEDRLHDLKNRVRINGFRPGKVPLNHLRKLYGKAAMAEIVQEMVAETSRQALEDREEKSAIQPKYDLPEDEGEADQVLSGQSDLAFTMSYEVIPSFDIGDLSAIKLERPIVDIEDTEVDEQVTRLAESTRTFSARDGAAEDGDRLMIDFVGKIDGEPFEGGAGEDQALLLGSNQFIPGFEEQLVGLKTGDEKTISVTFPEEYGATHLAGKDATFDVTVKEVGTPDDLVVDDALATKLGMESLDKLREAVRAQIENEFGTMTRQKIKRQLLDQLDEMHKFDVPPTLVEQEFDVIWNNVSKDMEEGGRSFEDEDTTEDKAREDYTKIAERRVRLGLVLSDIGQDKEIQVTDEEVGRAMVAQARNYPGQEQQILEFLRSNAEAQANLRAPLFEEKVVDYLIELADVTDKTVSKEELMKEDEDSELDAAAV